MGESGPAAIARRLAAARNGSNAAEGELFANCCNYLLLIANLAVKGGLQSKLGASDLVQETFAEAHRLFGRFQGETEGELLAWLTRILEHRIGNARRRYFGSAKRDIAREKEWREWCADVPHSEIPESGGETPSGVLAAKESHEQFQEGLNRLSADHQTVIRLRVEQSLPFEEIGQRMNRSAAAAQRLFVRAVMQLKSLLANHNDRRSHSN